MTPAIVVKRIREVYSHDMHNPPGCGPCELTRRGQPAREQARRLCYLSAPSAEQGSVGILPAARWTSKRHSGI
jgi:hypothetical protein